MSKRYVAGRYHGWDGGDCPVRDKTRVRIWCHNGDTYEGPASSFYWDHRAYGGEHGRDGNIVVFCVQEDEE
jgi:hypothetical protein